jgi:hypothetical protein
MTGNIQPAYQPIEAIEAHFGRRRGRRPSIDKAIKTGFMGLGFLIIAIILAFVHDGRGWWYWMLIPAFSMLGGGMAEYVRARVAQKALTQQQAQPTPLRSSYMNEMPPRGTNELMPPPPSVTEGTTRHLGAEGTTKVFTPAERPKQEG